MAPRRVYFEFYETLSAAFARETAIKRWPRLWKIRLIEQVNPTWEDLYDTLFYNACAMNLLHREQS